MTDELPHIRCITCNKVLAHKWRAYQALLSQGKSIKEALDMLGISRYCCRVRMMNPIKISLGAKRQTDPSERGLEEPRSTLTVATGASAPSIDPLQLMARVKGRSQLKLDDPLLGTGLGTVPRVSRAPRTKELPREELPQQERSLLHTVVPPATSEFDLPEIPQIALPPVPPPGAEPTETEESQIVRTYQAW